MSDTNEEAKVFARGKLQIMFTVSWRQPAVHQADKGLPVTVGGAITKDARKRFTNEHLARCARGMIERPTEMPPYLRNVLSWLAEKGETTET